MVEQGVSSIGAKSALNLSYDKVQSMTYEQFVQRATEQDEKIGLLEVNQYEDMHWNSLIQRSSIDPNAPDPSTFIPLYSIDNPITLFPKKVKLWNLNNFTEVESLIHSVSMHILFDFIAQSPKSLLIHHFRFKRTRCQAF